MPNWCSDKLTVVGLESDVQIFKEWAVGHSPWLKTEGEPAVLNFHSLVPVPEEVLKAGYESAGCDWEKENWGCKWGAQNPTILDEWEGHVEYEFHTAWSPPIEFLGKVAVQWPALVFVLEYEEPGAAFKGLAKFRGAIHEDHCISL